MIWLWVRGLSLENKGSRNNILALSAPAHAKNVRLVMTKIWPAGPLKAPTGPGGSVGLGDWLDKPWLGTRHKGYKAKILGGIGNPRALTPD